MRAPQIMPPMPENLPLQRPLSKTDLFVSFTLLALAGVAGMLAAPMVVVLLLAVAFGGVSDAAWAQGALRGMGAVSAGLIAAVGLKLISALRHNPMGMPVCTALAFASFVGVGILRWPLFYVLLGTGLVACSWAYWQLAKRAAHAGGRP